MSNLQLIISREYFERVTKKSFLISTILVPLLFIAISTLPALIMVFAKGEVRDVLVIDRSGIIAEQLKDSDEVRFSATELNVQEAMPSEDSDHFGLLIIGDDIAENGATMELYTSSASSTTVEDEISSQVCQIIEHKRLLEYDIDNLDQILEQVKAKVSIQNIRTDKDNATSSTGAATAMGFIMGFLLYSLITAYGSIVMSSVIEEKSSRVLDVLTTSVRPFDILMGKILGVAAVAVTQMVLWGVLVLLFALLALPMLLGSDAMASIEMIQQGGMANSVSSSTMGDLSPEMMQSLASLTDPSYIITTVGLMFLFLVGGYVLYSALFGAVGSAVDSVQDASQLQLPLMAPIIISSMVMIYTIRDPNSGVAFWTSIFPLTSPIIMMARIPYGIPTWEIALSLGVLYATMIAMVWVAARIYRVGIFMRGSKPTFKDLFRWIKS